MHDKFKQINRYLELLSDIIKEYKENDDIHIVDFGCGKSYLSFAVYYYLSVIKKLNVFLTGIDLKKEVVEDCKKLAEEYGYSGMDFFAMDIKDFVPKQKIDLVISLHACDIATDFVIHQAVKAGAKHIFSVPCCQKEVNKNIANSYEPILFRYGIIQERVSALITDAIRATVLELNGYKTDISEFVDLTDSPKNLLIRASLAAHSPSYLKKKREELNDLLVRVDAIPMIVKLLG